jgi:hypothetical protein
MNRKNKNKKYVRTTVSLPEDLWEKLRIESVKSKTPMGELIALKIKELERLRRKLRAIKD